MLVLLNYLLFGVILFFIYRRLLFFFQGLKTDDLPVIEKKGNYPSEEEYLNTYFRLLREECFYKLRKGISEFLANKSQFDSKDMMMYR